MTIHQQPNFGGEVGGYYGIVCDTVCSGEQALTMILASDTERRYDAVFVDLHMPLMDGVELISGIRSLQI